MDISSLHVDWSLVEGEGLVRVVPLDTFRQGMQLVVRITELADQHNHHPDVLLTSSKMVLTLISHDEQRVTERDIAFARALDELL
jgi:4a-hydroxytetrahydrobiopterin dehydratase